MVICEFCGNDDATVQVCQDCLAPHPGVIALTIAQNLGGNAEDYEWLGENIAEELGWSRP